MRVSTFDDSDKLDSASKLYQQIHVLRGLFKSSIAAKWYPSITDLYAGVPFFGDSVKSDLAYLYDHASSPSADC